MILYGTHVREVLFHQASISDSFLGYHFILTLCQALVVIR